MTIVMNHDATPVSFFRGSLNFYRATSIIVGSGERCPSDSFGFLVSHSLELVLKAFLLSKGYEESDLRNKIGHSLKKAWEKSLENGLNLEPAEQHWCDLLDSAHSAPFLFRYAKSNTGLVTPNQVDSHSKLGKVIGTVGKELGLDENGNFI